jgi:hypothetical protein
MKTDSQRQVMHEDVLENRVNKRGIGGKVYDTSFFFTGDKGDRL